MEMKRTGGEQHLGHRSYAKKERPTPQSCGKPATRNALRYPADAAGLPGGGLAGFSAGSRGSLGEELRKDRLDAREETQGISVPCRRIFSTRWGVHRIGTPSVYGWHTDGLSPFTKGKSGSFTAACLGG